MTAFSNLPIAPTTVEGGEEILVKQTGGTPFGRRPLATLVSFVLGTGPTILRGFYGASPTAQPAGAAQAAAPATPIAASAGATYTATERQLINDLKAQVNALTVLCNAQRAALVQLGLIKGGV